ncbi:S8 family serine peptidase [Bradyrhizobium sp. C9]|uniref:S8 family serine peptidase n=1 Tax=Bradyrhizobium sp. C9 TaxID=142585 RepID=UPI000BE91012|nr:S8 family serine peptidase [Bradyrhizobium sp. C9]PDT68522.1 hypothetical protein CO675_39085 [Bradyrhizobium sp. C9]
MSDNLRNFIKHALWLGGVSICAVALAQQACAQQLYLNANGTTTSDLEAAAKSWLTPEFNGDWGLKTMNAQYAYANRITGKDILIGVVDSGILSSHPKFQNPRIHVLSNQGQYEADGYRYGPTDGAYKQGDSYSDTGSWIDGVNDSHGTHVSGTIAASRDGKEMHGVAFDGELHVSNTGGTDNMIYGPNEDYNYFKGAYGNLVTAGVRVINSSWGNPPDEDDYSTRQGVLNAYMGYVGKKTWLDAAAEATQRRVIVVFTAGNAGFDNPSVRASLPYFRPELEHDWIAVTAINRAEKQRYNKCGLAKYWCLAAPGVGIDSTVVSAGKPSYERWSGTSMAAPHVTGALALVMQRYAYMTNEQARDVLLTTARQPKGNSGVNEIYGWGIPDLKAAMNGPGQLLRPENYNLPSGVTDAWSNSISDAALRQRKREEAQEIVDLTGEIAARGRDPAAKVLLVRLAALKAKTDAEYAGALTKSGGGTLILRGINSYTGATTVDGGALIVNGSIASSSMTTVNVGGLLGGTGTVGNVTINGGTLSPGNSIGLLSVQGNLVFTAAASYLVQVSPTNADRTNVTGTAMLGGASVLAAWSPGSYVMKRYNTLNAAGGVSGTFHGPVNTNLPKNFAATLSYDANDTYLNLVMSVAGLSRNQQSVSTALVNSFNRVGGIPLAFGALSPRGLTVASGEAATGIQQASFDAMNRFTELLTDPDIPGRMGPQGVAMASVAPSYAEESGAASAYAALITKAPPRVAPFYEPRWNVWATGYGGGQTTGGNALTGSAATTAQIYGTAVGADYHVLQDTVLGFAMGGAGTGYGLAGGLGSGRSDAFQAGVYGRHGLGAAYLSGALTYGWQDVTTDRTALDTHLRGRFEANALSGRLEGGYRFATSWLGVTPYAAGQFSTLFMPSYAEHALGGSGLFALSYTAKDVTASRSELGLRADRSFLINDGAAALTLRGRTAWAHNFNTDRSLQAAFAALPASGFIVNGTAQAADAGLVSVFTEVRWASGFSLAASFESEFSKTSHSYTGKGTVKYQW